MQTRSRLNSPSFEVTPYAVQPESVVSTLLSRSTPAPKRPRRRPDEPRIRSSKACETCRERRVRCSGPPPCQTCLDLGMAGQCVVRLKARPRRAEPGRDKEVVRSHSRSLPLTAFESAESLNSQDTSFNGIESNDISQSVACYEQAGTMTASATSGENRFYQPFDQRQWETQAQYENAQLNTRLQNSTGMGPIGIESAKGTPFSDIQTALEEWCRLHNVPYLELLFDVESCLQNVKGSPLPIAPALQPFEDLLFNSLFAGEAAAPEEELFVGHEWCFSLYNRHREIPDSLTDDQRALVFAMLCLARFAQIRSNINVFHGCLQPLFLHTREDITYYHMALDRLDKCQRPSIPALRALLCLNIISVGSGAPGDTKMIQGRIAHQIKTLGLHRTKMLDLYPPGERTQAVAAVSTFKHTDTFRAVMTDLHPLLPYSECDKDSLSTWNPEPSDIPESSYYYTSRFLADYADPMVDTTSRAYVTEFDGHCREQLRLLKGSKSSILSKEAQWADFRYNWLRLLLYIPLIAESDLAPEAPIVITRCVSRILHTYYALVAVQELNPSWPQIVRLVICGQVLVVIYDLGELNRCEGRHHFRMLNHLLSMHKEIWPVCERLIAGFSSAAEAHGIDLTPDVAPQLATPFPPAQELSAPESSNADNASVNFNDIFNDPFEGFQWSDIGLNFDLGLGQVSDVSGGIPK